MLPKRRPTKGVYGTRKADGPLRSPGHLAFVRSHECCIKGRGALEPHECYGPIVAAHVRSGTNGALGAKPGDEWTISLCDRAHQWQHAVGERTFEQVYHIDMKALAREFAAASPALRRLKARKESEHG